MKCNKCRNETFYARAIYEVKETVKLKKEKGEIKITVHDLELTNTSENINEYKCTKCGATYTMDKIKGEETLVLNE